MHDYETLRSWGDGAVKLLQDSNDGTLHYQYDNDSGGITRFHAEEAFAGDNAEDVAFAIMTHQGELQKEDILEGAFDATSV